MTYSYVDFETLDPRRVLAHAPFKTDLTHKWPIHPQTLQFRLEAQGFVDIATHDRQSLPADMLTVAMPHLAQASTPFECAVTDSMRKLQLIADLAFKNFIYSLSARRPVLG